MFATAVALTLAVAIGATTARSRFSTRVSDKAPGARSGPLGRDVVAETDIWRFPQWRSRGTSGQPSCSEAVELSSIAIYTFNAPFPLGVRYSKRTVQVR